MIEIQNVTDTESILSLLNRFDSIFPHMHEKISDYGAYAQKLARNALVYQAKDTGELCGLAVMYANNEETLSAYLSLLGVLPQWQDKAIGKEVLDFCCAEAWRRGMRNMRLEVDLDNQKAIAFYLRNKFLQEGACSSTSIFMKKEL